MTKTHRIISVTVALVCLFLCRANSDAPFDRVYCSQDQNVGLPFNGYCDSFGWFVPGYISNDTWMTPAPEYISGKMVFYNPEVMKATAEFRNIDYEEYGCIGGVSLMSPRDIGKKVWIKIDDTWYGAFCVVDSARRGDMYSIVVYRDEVVEVSFAFAEELGMVELHSDYTYDVNEWYKYVEVYAPNCNASTINPEIFNSEPIDYSEWFLDNVEFINYQENSLLPSENYDAWRVNVTGEMYYNDFMYNICYYELRMSPNLGYKITAY